MTICRFFVYCGNKRHDSYDSCKLSVIAYFKYKGAFVCPRCGLCVGVSFDDFNREHHEHMIAFIAVRKADAAETVFMGTPAPSYSLYVAPPAYVHEQLSISYVHEHLSIANIHDVTVAHESFSATFNENIVQESSTDFILEPFVIVDAVDVDTIDAPIVQEFILEPIVHVVPVDVVPVEETSQTIANLFQLVQSLMKEVSDMKREASTARVEQLVSRKHVSARRDDIIYVISDDEEVIVKEESSIVEDLPVQLPLKYAVVIEHTAAEVATIHAADEYFVVATIEQQPLNNAVIVQHTPSEAIIVVQQPNNAEETIVSNASFMEEYNYPPVEDLFECLEYLGGNTASLTGEMVADDIVDSESVVDDVIVLSSDSESDERLVEQHIVGTMSTVKVELTVREETMEEPPMKKRKYRRVDIDLERQVVAIVAEPEEMVTLPVNDVASQIEEVPEELREQAAQIESSLESNYNAVLALFEYAPPTAYQPNDIGIVNIREELQHEITYIDGSSLVNDLAALARFEKRYMTANRKKQPKSELSIKRSPQQK